MHPEGLQAGRPQPGLQSAGEVRHHVPLVQPVDDGAGVIASMAGIDGDDRAE
jgi:hypothetical protein